jgi:hypothetical protein
LVFRLAIEEYKICSGVLQPGALEASHPDPKFFSAMRYTYVIENGKDGQWYAGVTTI